MNTEKRQDELLDLYLKTMGNIKWRMKAVADIRNKVKSTSFKQTNVEFSVLQIRKVLELIAFSSLIADADVYKEKLGNVEKMKKAKRILNDIEQIHPGFYPKAIQIDPTDKYNLMECPEPYLSKELFVEVYDKCGKYLHESSPFLSAKQEDDEYLILQESITTWERLIINLLSTHMTHLYGGNSAYFIDMKGFDVDLPSIGWLMTKIDEDD